MINVFRTVLGSHYLMLGIVRLFAIYVMESPLKISNAEGPTPKIVEIIIIIFKEVKIVQESWWFLSRNL